MISFQLIFTIDAFVIHWNGFENSHLILSGIFSSKIHFWLKNICPPTAFSYISSDYLESQKYSDEQDNKTEIIRQVSS